MKSSILSNRLRRSITTPGAIALLLAALTSPTRIAKADPLSDADAAQTRKDYDAEMRILTPLAEDGNPIAQFRLGQMYEVGVGTPQDHRKAAYLFTKAAMADVPEAQWWLANAYHFGRGVPQNAFEEARWDEKAANHGYPDAQLALGMAYAEGRGVSYDLIKAYTWIKLAEQSALDPSLPKSWTKTGDEVAGAARDNLQIISPNMTSSQIEQAERLIKDFAPIGFAH